MNDNQRCPWCDDALPISDFNAFPQYMWSEDTQQWTCEICHHGIKRFWSGGKWSPWSKINEEEGS